jgi:hypothetical protein
MSRSAGSLAQPPRKMASKERASALRMTESFQNGIGAARRLRQDVLPVTR